MRQIRSALPRLSDRLGLRHAGHPVIAASCAVLSVAVLAEYVFSMAARSPAPRPCAISCWLWLCLPAWSAACSARTGSCGRRLSRA